jgi:prepilin peptidase CpaA
VSYVVPTIATGIFAVAAYSDIRRRRIPNVLPATLGVLGLARLIIAADPGAALYTGAAAVMVFIGGLLLFWRGLIGGGDVKLTAATVLLLGHHALPGFLLVTSLCGIAVTLAVLIADRVLVHLAAIPPAAVTAGSAIRLTVPYGVAIAASGTLLLLLQSPIPG